MSVKEEDVRCVLRTKVCESCAREVTVSPTVGMTYPPIYFYKCNECGHKFSSKVAHMNIVFIRSDGTEVRLL